MTLRLRVICRQAILLALVPALVLTAAVPAAMAQSASPTAQEPAACPAPVKPLAVGPVVAQGWVINHRELTLDGTHTSPPLQVNAISSAGAVASAPVSPNGYFKLALTPDVWNFSLQLPAEWDGIVPLTPSQVTIQFDPHASSDEDNLVVFKNRRR